MAVWVVALAEDLPVPVVRLGRVVEPVCGLEIDFDGDCSCHVSPTSIA
jgi:hypothetical protein